MHESVYFAKMDTPLEQLYVASTTKGLCKVQWVRNDAAQFFSWLHKHFCYINENVSFNKPIINQLEQYFVGKLKQFKVNLHLIGTDFQKKVWKELINIPYGHVCSYKEIAFQVGNPKGFRAIGMANNKNNISIIIPCHRVIGHDGKLVGYEEGLDIKEKLLVLEGRKIKNGKVVLE